MELNLMNCSILISSVQAQDYSSLFSSVSYYLMYYFSSQWLYSQFQESLSSSLIVSILRIRVFSYTVMFSLGTTVCSLKPLMMSFSSWQLLLRYTQGSVLNTMKYRVTPNDHMSVSEVQFSCFSIWGDMYTWVPSKVMFCLYLSIILATPKSASFGHTSCIRILEGLMSRCMIFFSWRNIIAITTWAKMRSIPASLRLSGRFVWMNFQRFPSAQYSRIRYMLFQCFLASIRRTMFGCLNFLRTLIQSRPLCQIFPLICISLMANIILGSPQSGAQPPVYTMAMPPRPKQMSDFWQISIRVFLLTGFLAGGLPYFLDIIVYNRTNNHTQMKVKLAAILTLVLSGWICLRSFMGPNAQNTQVIVIYPVGNLKVKSLYLRGDSCGLVWTKGFIMAYKGNNTWTLQLTCPNGVSISTKVLQNDTNWMMGQNHQFSILNTESVKTTTVYPSFYASINTIVDTTPISSHNLNNSRKCSIYYPPSWNDNTLKTYPLLLMHDGQNLFEDSKSAFGAWKIQDTLNSLIVQGKMKEIIVVGIWNTNNRNNEYTYSYDPSEKMGGKGDAYLNFIQEQLLPLINKTLNYRTKGPKVSIGGSSLGGLISCYAIHTRPVLYEKAVCMSSSFWWNDQDFPKTVLTKATNQVVYIDSGDSGNSQDSLVDTLKVKARYQQLGYTLNSTLFYYLDKGGQHNQNYWSKRFHIPMQELFP